VSTATIATKCGAAHTAPSLLNDTVGGEPTLEELLAGVWEGLTIHGSAACPVCDAAMEARYGAHARPIDGRCAACGSTLS